MKGEGQVIQAFVLGLLTAAVCEARKGTLLVRDIVNLNPPGSFDVKLGSGIVLRVSVDVVSEPEG